MVCGSVSTQAMELTPVAKYVVTGKGSSIRGVSLAPDEKSIYISGMNEKSMIKLDLATGELSKVSFADMGSKVAPKAVCADANGKVWVPLTVPLLAVLSSDLQIEMIYDLSPFGITTPEGALVSPTGDVYVTNRDNIKPGIFKFRVVDGQLAPVSSWGNGGYVRLTELRMPVFTPSGDLLMTAWTAGQIHLVKAADGQASVFIQGKSTFFLDVDSNGLVYVVHYDLKTNGLTVYNPDGTLLRTWTLAELGVVSEASSVAVSRDGKRLFILDQRGTEGGTLLIYDVKQ